MSKSKATGTSKLLMHEQPLQVLPGLAVALGLNEAIILQQLHYWLGRKSHMRDGREWYYNTYEDWKKQFPFWSVSTIKRAIIHLQAFGVITAANYNNSPIDKTKWYAINYDKLNDLCDSPTAQNEPSTGQDEPSTDHNDLSTAQNEPSTGQDEPLHGSDCPHQYPETNTESKPKESLPSVEIPPPPQMHDTAKRVKPAKAPQLSTAYSPGFERVWNAYPQKRKERKVDTFAIWQDRNLEDRATEIAEKLERLQLTLWKDREPKYIPLPTTWFNQGRYEDDLVPLPDFDPVAENVIDAKTLRSMQAAQRIMEESAHAPERPRGFLSCAQHYGGIFR